MTEQDNHHDPEREELERRLLLSPWDHNGECLWCDGLGEHEPDCPWVKAKISRLSAIVRGRNIWPENESDK